VCGLVPIGIFLLSALVSNMVGEIDSVSPTFSLFRGGLFWLGGFAIIFLTIVVIVSLSDTANTAISSRNAAPSPPRRGARGVDNEPTMGLTPETAAQPVVEE